MSRLLVKVPSFKVNPGTLQTYDADLGLDPFGHEVIVPITTRCPEWQDETKDWTGRVIKRSKHLPFCWGPDTIATYFDLSGSFIRNLPVLFEQSLLRRPKCIIFCNYALAGSISTVVADFKDQLEKHQITVFALQDIWPNFAVNGLPVKEITLSSPIGPDGTSIRYEMPTLLDRSHFSGGKVMVISDFDENYKGSYGFNYFPYFPNELLDPDLSGLPDGFDVLGQIPDCIRSFDKINNYIYFFCSEGFRDFYQETLNDNTGSDYFNVNVFAGPTWRDNAFSLAKTKLYSDIADFFNLVVP